MQRAAGDGARLATCVADVLIVGIGEFVCFTRGRGPPLTRPPRARLITPHPLPSPSASAGNYTTEMESAHPKKVVGGALGVHGGPSSLGSRSRDPRPLGVCREEQR